MIFKRLPLLFLIGSMSFAVSANKPADTFDLSHWKITLPMDADGNGEVDYDEFKTMMVKLLRDDHGNNNTMSKYAEMEKELAARQQAAAS